MTKTPETTDWSSASEQQFWFDQFKSAGGCDGIRFAQFQELLQATVYRYFSNFPAEPSTEDQNSHKFSYQQEIQLFKIFDVKNDHIIDRDEFASMCQSWLDKTYRRSCALVVVDVQNDFIDGSLALINGPAREDGADVVPVINDILDENKFNLVVYTLDWHPPNHIGFHENLHLRKYRLKLQQIDDNNKATPDDDLDIKFKLKKLAPRAQMFDTVLFDEGRMEQKLWPTHCVQNSWGAQLHPKLIQAPGSIKIHKGSLAHVDAYSAFWDNMRLNETGLRQELLSRKISDVFFCGLALDYCVAASALDSVKAGFVTFVIEDACRGIDRKEMDRRKTEMKASGIFIIKSSSINSYLRIHGNGSSDTTNGCDSNDLVASESLVEQSITGCDAAAIDIKHNNNSYDNKLNDTAYRSLIMEVCFNRALAIYRLSQSS